MKKSFFQHAGSQQVRIKASNSRKIVIRSKGQIFSMKGKKISCRKKDASNSSCLPKTTSRYCPSDAKLCYRGAAIFRFGIQWAMY